MYEVTCCLIRYNEDFELDEGAYDVLDDANVKGICHPAHLVRCLPFVSGLRHRLALTRIALSFKLFLCCYCTSFSHEQGGEFKRFKKAGQVSAGMDSGK